MLVTAPEGAKAEIDMLDTRERLPWAGHSARHALGEIYEALRRCKLALIFTNTRFQAEQLFWDLWKHNSDNLPIALHHGSLDATQRRRVEAAMAAGTLKAVVCTATLDLGIDWGDVDLVINVGAPKGASRIIQRIGRATTGSTSPRAPSWSPRTASEVIECRAAIDAAAHGVQDTPVPRTGALDVLAQHVLGMACAAPFHADDLFSEITDAAPFAHIDRETFDGSSTSWRTAATRSGPTTASPRSVRIRKGAGASRTAAWRSNTGSMSAPSWPPPC